VLQVQLAQLVLWVQQVEQGLLELQVLPDRSDLAGPLVQMVPQVQPE